MELIIIKKISSAYMSVLDCAPFSERIIIYLCFKTW